MVISVCLKQQKVSWIQVVVDARSLVCYHQSTELKLQSEKTGRM